MDNNMIFRTVLIILAAFVLFALINYYNNKQTTMKTEKFFQANNKANDSFEDMITNFNKTEPVTIAASSQPRKSAANTERFEQQIDMVAPSEPVGNEDYRAVDFQNKKLPNDCFPKDRLTAEDLLPKDAANSKWAQVNPAGQGDVKDQNFLSAGYMIGINTVGSSLKNANLQLRSEPVIPKVSVGPFLNSTYEASDVLRRPLEIGGDC
jgi:hypothetical protein